MIDQTFPWYFQTYKSIINNHILYLKLLKKQYDISRELSKTSKQSQALSVSRKKSKS
jgi:hypothetical protein